MVVRFADTTRVVTFQELPGDREFRRSRPEHNIAYRRERRLYELVMQWKSRNAPTAARRFAGSDDVEALLGRTRGAAARELFGAAVNVAGLQRRVAAYVHEQWPLHDCKLQDFEVSSSIVLSVVAEFLCKSFYYDLRKEAESSLLYADIFFLCQSVLSTHFAIVSA